VEIFILIIGELYISNAMIAEGVEAKREAEINCLTEPEIVLEIYMAMAGTALRVSCEGEDSVQ
jgi:hypothetical protein